MIVVSVGQCYPVRGPEQAVRQLLHAFQTVSRVHQQAPAASPQQRKTDAKGILHMQNALSGLTDPEHMNYPL